MTRRTIHTALTLIAMAGLAVPAMAQTATNEAPARERVRQQREGAPPVDEAAGRQARERQVNDEDMMQRRREALDQAVENGRMTREQADAMLERMRQRQADGDQPMDREGMRGRFGGEALPAQINKFADLKEDQHAKVNELIRELRQKQMEAMREMWGGPAAGRAGGPGADDAAGDDARPRRGAPGEAERPQRGGAAGDDARPRRGGAAGDEARPQRGAPGEGERPQRGGAGAGATDDAGGAGGALRGPQVPREGGGRGGPDEMGMGAGPGGPGGFGQMSEDERAAFAKELREKLIPINRQFGKDLAGVLDEGQRKAVREHWEELSIMPPMVERMIEAEKQAKKDKADEAKKGKDGKGKDAKGDGKRADDAEGDDGDRPAARGRRAEPRQQGRRGGRGGDDD